MKIHISAIATLAVFLAPVQAEDFSIGGGLSDFEVEDLAVVMDRPNKCCPNSYDCPVNAFRRDGQNCYEDYTDCICDYGYTMTPGPDGLGACIPEYVDGCANDYQCPPNSWRDPGYDGCFDSFDGCWCDYGFNKNYTTSTCDSIVAGACLNDVQCPKNAWRRAEQGCWNSIEDDCVCDELYELIDDECLPVPTGPGSCTDTGCEYECPANSTANTAECPSAFSDCDCVEGYGIYGDSCMECTTCPSYSMASTECPVAMTDCACEEGFAMVGEQCCMDKIPYANMEPITEGSCVTSIEHCKCIEGYEPDGNNSGCVESCQSFYQCPEHSTYKADISCYQSISDCECEAGFIPSGDQCCMEKVPYANMEPITEGACVTSIEQCKCIEGYEPDGNNSGCVESCTSTFQCPEHSTYKADVSCYQSMADCECDVGYVALEGMCIPDTCTWPRQPIGTCCTDRKMCDSNVCGAISLTNTAKVCCSNAVKVAGTGWVCA